MWKVMPKTKGINMRVSKKVRTDDALVISIIIKVSLLLKYFNLLLSKQTDKTVCVTYFWPQNK
uniref:Uncharacterized protein n=1 Tax=Romanomermis culicivorax TaxID=13658 RepID=A0A915JIE0_ROMCU